MFYVDSTGMQLFHMELLPQIPAAQGLIECLQALRGADIGPCTGVVFAPQTFGQRGPSEQAAEVRFRADIQQCRVEASDTGVGQTGASRLHWLDDPLAAEFEISLRMLTRVVHQHDLAEVTGRESTALKVVVGVDVAVHQQKGTLTKQHARLPQALCGAERVISFVRPVDVQTKGMTVAETRRQERAEVGPVDHYFPNAGSSERREVSDDERPTTDSKQGFRHPVGERSHALTATGGEDEGLHTGWGAALVRQAGSTSSPMNPAKSASSGQVAQTRSR